VGWLVVLCQVMDEGKPYMCTLGLILALAVRCVKWSRRGHSWLAAVQYSATDGVHTCGQTRLAMPAAATAEAQRQAHEGADCVQGMLPCMSIAALIRDASHNHQLMAT
jgi:hypothetical protein